MKIIAAEDEELILRLYKLLCEHDGHQFVGAKDGQECVLAFRKAMGKNTSIPPFDLAILDYKMPKRTGLEVAEEMLAICPEQKIVIVTAFDVEVIDNFEKGKLKVIKKPIDPDELMSIIESYQKPVVLA